MVRPSLVAAGLALACALTLPGVAYAAGLPDLTVPAGREVEPVILDGSALGDWAVPANQTARLPLIDLACNFEDECPHSHYAEPTLDTAAVAAPAGTPVERLLGYRWDTATRRFVQIPFQVDEQFTRYLNNSASGFAVYSGEDQHTTYAYPREGFRYTADGPASDPCRAQPASAVATDPVAGLDHNDEIAFMARDAGPRAPEPFRLPAGVLDSKTVRIADPSNPTATPRFVYVMKVAAAGPKAAFDASNGHVRYQRDPNADLFAFSESSYDNYGAAPHGLHCDADGNVVRNTDGSAKIAQRRPRDGAWITTPRYRFRYDGRWLMTRIEISPDEGASYGPDLVDRWKARAFAQDPGSNTPCCGYEEEDTNWGGSSILLGEKVGPVRAIRETWGADSGTNVVRRETFYRDTMRQKTWLRVHVIPPLDGIYAQWDFNAGRVNRFYNSSNPQGVAIDGRNDEVFGNFDDPCEERYDANDTSDVDQGYRNLYRTLTLCNFEYHMSVDPGDPTFADANAALGWSQVSGPHGTIVDRITTEPGEMPAGGSAQSLVAVPYYRDDACFDDGTGSNPGPVLNLRSANELRTLPDGTARQCWSPEKVAVPADDPRYFQGSIGTHGVHLLFLVDTDNARQTVPLTEIINEWQMIMLPGDPGNVGERYGRSLEKPLATTVLDRDGTLQATLGG